LIAFAKVVKISGYASLIFFDFKNGFLLLFLRLMLMEKEVI